MSYSRRDTLCALATLGGTVATIGTLAGSVATDRPSRFDRLTVEIQGSEALWVGAFGFRSAKGAFRGEDLFGFGPQKYLLPEDLRTYPEDTTLYSPIQLLAAPMAGFDPDEPMRATITHGPSALASDVATRADDAISLRFD